MKGTESTPNPIVELMNATSAVVLFVAVALVALIVRLIVLDQIGADPHLSDIGGDGQAYLKWAHAIAGGEWIGREVFYPSPLYPYLAAVFFKLVSTSLHSLLTLHAVMGAAGCGLMCLATRKLVSPAAGLIAGLLLAFYPPAISYDLQIDKTVLDPPLAALTLWCLGQVIQQPRGKWFFACGVALGIFSLTRENALALLAPIIGWTVWQYRDQARSQVASWIGFLLLGTFVAVFPVCLRNSLLGGKFYMSTAKFGANFYYGNCAQADGIYFPLRPGRGDLRWEQIDATEIAEQAVGHPLQVGQVSSWWTRRTLADIEANPGRWLNLSLRKIAMFWCDTEIADADIHDRHIVFSPLLRLDDRLWGFRVVLVLSAVGAASLSFRRSTLVMLLLSMALVYAAAIAVFILFGRYRLPVVPLLLPLAAGAIVTLPSILQSRNWRVLTLASIVATGAIGLCWLGDRCIPLRIAGTNPYNRGNIAASIGRRDLAVPYYREAIRENPTLAPAHSNLSLQLADVGSLAAAEAESRQAIALDPTDPASRVNLGMILARRHDLPEAVREFQAAIALDPQNHVAHQNLDQANRLMAYGPTSQP